MSSSILFVGAVLCHPEFPVPLVCKLEARIVVLDVMTPLLQGQQVRPVKSSEGQGYDQCNTSLRLCKVVQGDKDI